MNGAELGDGFEKTRLDMTVVMEFIGVPFDEAMRIEPGMSAVMISASDVDQLSVIADRRNMYVSREATAGEEAEASRDAWTVDGKSIKDLFKVAEDRSHAGREAAREELMRLSGSFRKEHCT